MNYLQKIGVAALAGLALVACVSMSNGMSIVKTTNGMLVGTNNMTLYTFDNDQANSGKSNCNGDCAMNWPPLVVDKNATSYGSYSIITRDDGKKQFAYKGMPLYYYSLDKKPGEQNGNGYANNTWHVVKM
jgi:predicted lipoprotein with Yx(FWY)xxD motif